ncbi:MAG: hypothetical protein COA79_10180 [Planctomycetota bacterium]|nr:MAG: hypothetical protein COA79_10180 [Planctomycetota bacterium]
MKYLLLDKTPYENGLTHGEAFKEDIHLCANVRLDLLKGYLEELTWDQIQILANKEIEVLKKSPLEYEEFSGIAKGANISEVLLAVLNNYTDMRNFSESTLGCSALYYKSDSTSISGQTWDMTPEALPYVLHLEIKGEPSLHILTITGCLALSGFSSLGVSAFMNDLKTTETSIGLMWPALMRKILRAPTAQQGHELLTQNLPSSGHHYLISDKYQAYSIETTGKQYEVVQNLGSNGYSIHTNHYKGRLGGTVADSSLSASTKLRDEAMDNYFKASNDLTFDNIAQNVFAKELGSGGVAMLPSGDSPAAITCGGMMYDHLANNGIIYNNHYSKENIKKIGF